jgi:hypothetical protein
MEMENRLPGPGIVVVYYPEAILVHSFPARDVRSHPEGVTNNHGVFLLQIKGIYNMLSGNNQQMQRGDRRDILYDHKDLILIDLPGRYLTGNNPAENASFH